MKQNNEVRIIGVTGGIGAGKSEILSYIKKHYNCKVYLADEVAHKVKEVGQVAYRPLIDLLGEGILDEDGNIHKERMAQVIFSDETLLSKVNAIVHPAVRQFVEEAIADARQKKNIELLFIEAALLIEAGYETIIDELWYIYATIEVRTKRLMENRGYTPLKVQSIMDKQLSEEEFKSHADFVIDNSGKLSETYEQIDNKLEGYTWLE